jgi:hypothetical protein
MMGWFTRLFGSTATGQSPGERRQQGASPQPQAKTCPMPFHLLQHIFVLASGDAGELSGAVLVGILEEFTEHTFDEIMKQARQDLISKSPYAAEIVQTQQMPDRAFHAMEVIAPALITKFRKGEIQLFIQAFEDPLSGQSAAILLFYKEA